MTNQSFSKKSAKSLPPLAVHQEIGAALQAYVKSMRLDSDVFGFYVGIIDAAGGMHWAGFAADKEKVEMLADQANLARNLPGSLVQVAINNFKLAANENKQPYLEVYPVADQKFKITNVINCEAGWLSGVDKRKVIADYKNKVRPLKGSVPCLFPLLQMIGEKPQLVGAVIVYAKPEAEVWGHLPVLKSIALPLLESHRNIFGISPDSFDDAEVHFLRLFLSYYGENRLFTDKIIRPKSEYVDTDTYHGIDSRLFLENVGGNVVSCVNCTRIESVGAHCFGKEGKPLCRECQARYLKLLCCKKGCWSFKKALFCNDGDGGAYQVGPISKAIKASLFCECLEKISNSKHDGQLPRRDVRLPSQPGMLSLLAIGRVISRAGGEKFRVESLEDSVRITAPLRKPSKGWTPMGLSGKFLELGYPGRIGRTAGGSTATALWSAIFGNFAKHSGRFKSDPRTSKNESRDLWLDPMDRPLFMLNIELNRLTLWWHQ